MFDEIIIRHDEDMRGRTVEEVEGLVLEGIHQVRKDLRVTKSLSECEAVVYAIENCRPGTLIVVLTENIKKVTACVQEYNEKERQLQRAV